MGVVLRRSSFSPNIKERRDFSCALFTAQGQLVAQAEHIPVHLGAMPYSVQAVLKEFGNDLSEGDDVILNDPYRGGTHLPDITMVSPIFFKERLVGFAANRAHHSDVGGVAPGSMSALSRDVNQEGIRIPPIKLWSAGKQNRQLLDFVLTNVRTPDERLGDLRAQRAANLVGVKRLIEQLKKSSVSTVESGMNQLIDYSEELMVKKIRELPRKSSSAVDFLDDDGFGTRDIPVKVKITVGREFIAFDFSGSAKQVQGPLNAVYSVTLSAVYYVVRCVTDPSIPANAGCFKPIQVKALSGTIVNADPPAPVAGGNVETSTRIVDVTLKAFSRIIPERVCAACQGTMNNVTIGGVDPRTGKYFTYYETIAGGFGARYNRDGVDGIHSHMTNTLNTPVEALEAAYPLRVRRYELMRGSGGRGRFRGGLGIRRETEVLAEGSTISLMGERQRRGPWGLFGGDPGSPGEYGIVRENRITSLSSKTTFSADSGYVLTVTTPGGGGYGPASRRAKERMRQDRADGKA
ncbi:MAG: 5-oxoprolinase [Crenarchaeota archaeon 13_1_40CM_2_52_14]|nr:MAG: 5-oxoprolinase [Crenarchaeota archaeon 13_1_40CM_3_52_17]OLD35510.1 MAG: 5-oxoprolinase [Crenarchaeota archaeon 13_1_40CM_2_52_14]OLE70647.1 MAG: 5-oxoprolinase [archaeon 13_1_20CM_2_51_12]